MRIIEGNIESVYEVDGVRVVAKCILVTGSITKDFKHISKIDSTRRMIERYSDMDRIIGESLLRNKLSISYLGTYEDTNKELMSLIAVLINDNNVPIVNEDVAILSIEELNKTILREQLVNGIVLLPYLEIDLSKIKMESNIIFIKEK